MAQAISFSIVNIVIARINIPLGTLGPELKAFGTAQKLKGTSLTNVQFHHDGCCREEQPNVVWTGYAKKTPILIFSAQNMVNRKSEAKGIGGRQMLH